MRPSLRPLPLAFALALAPQIAGAATITVTTTSGADVDDVACSLPEAIVAANQNAAYHGCSAGAGPDRIVFALVPPSTILLAADLPTVTETLRVQGPGATDLTISGQDANRLFVLAAGDRPGWFQLDGMTLSNALSSGFSLADYGGAVRVEPGGTARLVELQLLSSRALAGAALAVSGGDQPATTEVVACSFDGNQATAAGGAGAYVEGGATLIVRGSTFHANSGSAPSSAGGAIYVAASTLRVESSTFDGNVVNASGGAVYVAATGGDASFEILDSTFTDNLADDDGNGGHGGALFASAAGDAVFAGALRNNVFAQNLEGGDPSEIYLLASLAANVSTGWNLIYDVTNSIPAYAVGSPNAAGDFVGNTASPVDPLLEALADNGGPTLTRRPILDLVTPQVSPAIDHGSCPDAGSDQRGRGDRPAHTRRFDHPDVSNDAASDGCDIGAVERGGSVRSAPDLFADDFELGHTLLWDGEV